jgi:hypothetical protein
VIHTFGIGDTVPWDRQDEVIDQTKEATANAGGGGGAGQS